MYFCTRNSDLRSVAKLKGSGFSAVGSAHVWGARGRWFESSNPDNKQGYRAGFSAVSFIGEKKI